jgi:hypothetical protein
LKILNREGRDWFIKTSKKTGLAGTGGVLPEKRGVFSLDFVLVKGVKTMYELV